MANPRSRPTISDVAAHAGVSKKTVSFVLNEQGGIAPATRARVLESVAALGFVPDARARALAGGKSALVALLHDGGDDALLAAAIAGAGRALAGSGSTLDVRRVEADAAAIPAYLAAHRPRGAILLPPLAPPPDDAAGETHALALPHRQAAIDAVQYLQALGHERIALVPGAEDDPTSAEHEAGYLAAMPPGCDLIAPGDGTCAAGQAAGLLLAELSPRPTAIVAANLATAAGLAAAARRAGLAIPADLSLIALADGGAADLFDPPLSAMRLPVADLAAAAVDAMLGRPPARLPGAVSAQLVRRGSTAAAPL